MRLWNLYKNKQNFIKPSLERIKRACEYIGNPQRKFMSILVGGTNGKGSTCAFIERILREKGLKTGWFVSPHLIDERERWRINGNMMKEEELYHYVNELKHVFEKFDLTYFEACTLIAVLYFADNNIEAGVFEVGMGGRWDATKIVNPEVTVLTNVGRDHTKWLGDTLEEIAKDKLHLYNKGKPFIIGEFKYPLSSLINPKNPDITIGGYDFLCKGIVRKSETVIQQYIYKDTTIENLKVGIWGRWQITNASISITAVLKFLGSENIDHEIIKSGIEQANIEGRMEIVRKEPVLILDCAHNPHAISRVVKEVKRYFPNIKILFSSLKDKEWKSSLSIIRNYTDEIIITKINHPRAEDCNNIAEEAKMLGFRNIDMLENPSDVLSLNFDILTIGSIYLIGEVKGMLKFLRK